MDTMSYDSVQMKGTELEVGIGALPCLSPGHHSLCCYLQALISLVKLMANYAASV